MPAKLVYRNNPSPDVTIIVPSLDGVRDGNLERLVGQLTSQTIASIEIIVALNESPNGHARNVGIALASASSRFYAFFDDDVRLGSDCVLENLLHVLEDERIGLVGASQLPPPDSSPVQKWIGYDMGKAKFDIQKSIVDTEMATHAGMACRRAVWEEMGGESDTLVTGTDTDLRERLRNAGYRVVVAPDTWVFHPMPDAVGKVLKAAIRHGWHQLDYRRVHGFQTGALKPFQRIASVSDFVLALAREVAIFVPGIFIANRQPAIGFRPINALHRLLMAGTYTMRAFRERHRDTQRPSHAA